jgi:dolichyl-diphosphooligosaccharide--protein glycosyltransferase
MFKAQLRTGEQIIVDDYREGYFWLRDNTPEDARVLSWWDYGYQITGIGERTTLADGNTWNHEHIATLGRILTSPEKRAHNIAKHLADYVLVWAGGGGDDLAKSPHMARIGNSIYSDMCPDDPTCRKFGFNRDGTPTKMMKESLLYKLTQCVRDSHTRARAAPHHTAAHRMQSCACYDTPQSWRPALFVV